MIYILYLIMVFGSPGNDGISLVLQSPRQFRTIEDCQKEGENFQVKTDLPIKDAAVFCKPEVRKQTYN